MSKERQRKENIKNRGYITVEACLVVPLFLFFMLALAEILMLFMAEAKIHQCLSEASIYTAQYCYLQKSLQKDKTYEIDKLITPVFMKARFDEYINKDFYVEKMISGGTSGILITVKKDTTNSKVFVAKARYRATFHIPFIGNHSIVLTDTIKQKSFVGYSKEEQSDIYVYVSENEAVYHMKRNCTHLALSVSSKSSKNKGGYLPCGFCGKKYNDTGTVYIARTGEVYHYLSSCSGLKRTVRRIKLTEAGGLSACSRCGR